MPKRPKQKVPEPAPAHREPKRGNVLLLWGARERPSRGPKPALSVEAIVRAGIAVADREGLGAVTMARVAAQLEVTTMALYRYVPGKDELLDLMTDGAFGSPPPAGGGPWRAEVRHCARACLRMFSERPWVLEAVLRRAPIGPRWLSWLNALLEAFAGSGLKGSEVMRAVMLVDGHVRSAAQLTLGPTGTGSWATSFGVVLEVIAADPRYGAIAATARSGGFEFSLEGPESAFEFGLDRLLDGLEAFVAARRPAAPARRSKARKR